LFIKTTIYNIGYNGSPLVATYIQRQKTCKFKKGKKKRKLYLKITGSLYYCTLLIIEFLLFSTVLLFVETVSPIRTFIVVHLMVSFIVNILEYMKTRFAFLYNKP